MQIQNKSAKNQQMRSKNADDFLQKGIDRQRAMW